MDIQLHVTNKELKEFLKEGSDQIGTNIVNRADTSLLISKAKTIQKAHMTLMASQRKTMKGRRTMNKTMKK